MKLPGAMQVIVVTSTTPLPDDTAPLPPPNQITPRLV